MHNYFADYCTLLGSQQQLTHCQQAQSLGDLLARIKQLWNCPQLDDNALLGEINRLNQIPVDDVMLAGNWLPYRYRPKRKIVNWLIPVGHATEPFQDEYLSRCSQQLFNQIIQPRSSLEYARRQAINLPQIQPAGFIFHLSRCGSTLISGCLSEVDSTCIFSEPPLLTELLLDNQLSWDDRKAFLSSLINLQAAAFPPRPQIIIKCNAWDIFQWELIRSVYPLVPSIFLVRDPVEILASHARCAGRHMAGDPSLTGVHPVFSVREESLLIWRSNILHAMLEEMGKWSCDPQVLRVDYRHLDAMQIRNIAHHFGIFTAGESLLAMSQRLQFHSKTPGIAFAKDSDTKQLWFTADDKANINQWLMPLYMQFFQVGDCLVQENIG